MDVIVALFNLSLLTFIVATMFSAGLSTTVDEIRSVFQRVGLIAGVLVVAFVVRPLLGWGLAELFGLATPAFIATVLLASCPGAPFGAKLVDNANADLTTGAVLQAMLATIAAFTFAPTTNLIVEAADLGDSVSLPVGDLIKTVAFLQIIPFLLGILIRHWTPSHAESWHTPTSKVANLSFLLVVVGATLGSWRTVVDLIGSRALIAAAAFALLAMAFGYYAAVGPEKTKQAASLIQPNSNAGPAFAAVAIAFDNDPVILGSVTALIFVHAAVSIGAAAFVGREDADRPVDSVSESSAAPAI